jgi:branched-chain amino acid transport system substrate-binding protein
VARHAFRSRRYLPPVGNRFRLDAVYAPVPGTQLVQIIPQMAYHGVSLPMLGSDSWDDDTLRKRPEAVTVDSCFTTGFWPDLEAPVTRRFVQRYKEAYAAPPDALAANAYDAAFLLMNAIGRSDRTREGLREAISAPMSFDGVCGAVRMTPQRDIEKDPIILRVANGTIATAP